MKHARPAVLIVVLAAAGCSSSALPTAPPSLFGAHAIHYAMPVSFRVEQPLPAVNDFVTYHNGPVLVSPKIYLIFWGFAKYGDPDNVEKLLTAYTQSVGGT